MKKLIFLCAIISTALLSAQVPQGISYQAIAMNPAGQILTSLPVGIRLSILDNSATGTVKYTESHIKQTNENGLFTLVIGQGTPSVGTFDGIDWGTNSKFLKVEMDAEGGTSYTLVGTTQLLSVPYALFSGNASSVDGTGINDNIVDNQFTNYAFDVGSGVYIFNHNLGSWAPLHIIPTGNTDIIGSNGNFAVSKPNSPYAVHAYNKNTNSWSVQTGRSSPPSNLDASSLIGSNGNFLFYDYLGSKICVFNKDLNSWSVSSGSSPEPIYLVSTNGNFAYYNETSNRVIAYDRNTGTFVTSPVAGAPLQLSEFSAANGNFFYKLTNPIRLIAFSANTGAWSLQTLSSSITSGTLISSPTN